MIKLTIPGRPVPAVRMTQRSKYKSKQAQRYLDYKNTIGWEAKVAGAREPKLGAMKVTATAYIRLMGREQDIDNLAKAFLDGLNGVVWVDDYQVTELNVKKVYVSSKDEERAEIEIQEVDTLAAG